MQTSIFSSYFLNTPIYSYKSPFPPPPGGWEQQQGQHIWVVLIITSHWLVTVYSHHTCRRGPRPGQASGQFSWSPDSRGKTRAPSLHITHTATQCQSQSVNTERWSLYHCLALQFKNIKSQIFTEIIWYFNILPELYIDCWNHSNHHQGKNWNNYLQETARDSPAPQWSDQHPSPRQNEVQAELCNNLGCLPVALPHCQLSISEIQISHRDPKEEEVNLEPVLLSNIIPLRHSY